MATIFAIDGADFGNFGAASSAVASLQTGLKALGQGVGDNTLRAIVVDGLIGPKTTAATNRALTVHVGSGQAPASFRTGALTQAEVVANAATLASIVDAEAARRGYSVPTTAVIKAVATKTAVSAPKAVATAVAPYTPPLPSTIPSFAPPAAADDSTATIVKYAAIGLGLVVATAGIYYVIKRKPAPAMAGFGAGGFYHTDPREFTRGQRVQLHPGTDAWMRGDRYGEIVKINKKSVRVKLDKSGRVRNASPANLEIIEG